MDIPIAAPRPEPVPAGWVPVDACTLPTAEQPLRIAEFDALFRTFLRAVEGAGSPTRARLVLAGGADLPDRVQQLADAETACCSFFTFTLTALPGGPPVDGCAPVVVVALDVEVPPTRTGVLAALVDRAEHMLGTVA